MAKSAGTKSTSTKPNGGGVGKPNPASWLGTPVLIPGENFEAFDKLSASVRAALGPVDAIESILVDDFVAHDWAARRWRRLQGGLLIAGTYAGLKNALTPLIGAAEAAACAQGWAKRDPAKVAEVEQFMTSRQLSVDVLMAESATTKIDNILRVDGLQASHEGRRAAALRELERYRAGAGHAVEEIVEAAFEEVSGGGTSPGRA